MSDAGRGASVVETWFGTAYADSHPQLLALHRNGGELTGPVAFETGRGIPRPRTDSGATPSFTA